MVAPWYGADCRVPVGVGVAVGAVVPVGTCVAVGVIGATVDEATSVGVLVMSGLIAVGATSAGNTTSS